MSATARYPSSHLCVSCYGELTPAKQAFTYGGSLFKYTPPLRRLILRAKVSSDEYALRCLCELMLRHPRTSAALSACQQIVAAPSSLWGRLRGRLDLAWFLSDSLAHHFVVQRIPAPRHLYWRLNKRAQMQGRRPASLLFPYHTDNIPTLIIDDLITTGHTLQRIARALKGANCRFLTLADAYTGPAVAALSSHREPDDDHPY